MLGPDLRAHDDGQRPRRDPRLLRPPGTDRPSSLCPGCGAPGGLTVIEAGDWISELGHELMMGCAACIHNLLEAVAADVTPRHPPPEPVTEDGPTRRRGKRTGRGDPDHPAIRGARLARERARERRARREAEEAAKPAGCGTCLACGVRVHVNRWGEPTHAEYVPPNGACWVSPGAILDPEFNLEDLRWLGFRLGPAG